MPIDLTADRHEQGGRGHSAGLVLDRPKRALLAGLVRDTESPYLRAIPRLSLEWPSAYNQAVI